MWNGFCGRQARYARAAVSARRHTSWCRNRRAYTGWLPVCTNAGAAGADSAPPAIRSCGLPHRTSQVAARLSSDLRGEGWRQRASVAARASTGFVQERVVYVAAHPLGARPHFPVGAERRRDCGTGEGEACSGMPRQGTRRQKSVWAQVDEELHGAQTKQKKGRATVNPPSAPRQ